MANMRREILKKITQQAYQEQSHIKIVAKFAGLVRLVNLILLQSHLKVQKL
jgi:hypothetical protein